MSRSAAAVTALATACVVVIVGVWVYGLDYLSTDTHFREITQKRPASLHNDAAPRLTPHTDASVGALDVLVTSGPGTVDDEEVDVGFNRDSDEMIAVPTATYEENYGLTALAPDGTYAVSIAGDAEGDILTLHSIAGHTSRDAPAVQGCDTIVSVAFGPTGTFHAQYCDALVTFAVGVDGSLRRTQMREGFFANDDCLLAARGETILSASRREIVVTSTGDPGAAKVHDAGTVIATRDDYSCYPTGALSADLRHAVVVGEKSRVFVLDLGSGAVSTRDYPSRAGERGGGSTPYLVAVTDDALLWSVVDDSGRLGVWAVNLGTGETRRLAALDTMDPALNVTVSARGVELIGDSELIEDIVELEYY